MEIKGVALCSLNVNKVWRIFFMIFIFNFEFKVVKLLCFHDFFKKIIFKFFHVKSKLLCLRPKITIQIVSKSRSVDNSEPQFDAFFFNFHRGFLNIHRLFEPFIHRWHFPIIVQIRQKQRIDQSWFSKTRFTNHHQRKIKSSFHTFSVNLWEKMVAWVIDWLFHTFDWFRVYENSYS